VNILKQYEEEQLAKQHKVQLGIDFDEPPQSMQPRPTYDFPTANVPYTETPIGNFYPTVEPVPAYQIPTAQPVEPKSKVDERDQKLLKKFYPGKY